MNMLLMVLAVYWSMTLVFGSKAESVGSVIKVWVVAAGLVLAVKGWTLGFAIADGARVFGQLRMPQRLWREWLRATLADSMRAWGILALGGTVLLMLPESPWKWSSAVAMFSAILSLSTIAAWSNYGLVHRAWAWAISAGVALYAMFAALTIGLAHGLDIFGQSPSLVQGLLAISWPLLTYVVAIVWLRQSPTAPASFERSRHGLWARISAYARRYTLLTNAARTRSSASPYTGHIGVLLNQAFVFPILALQWLAVPWNGNVGPYHFLILGFLSFVSLQFLACKNLHWRQLLAPGGLHHGRLGWHILGTNLVLQTVGYLIVASLWIAVSWAAFDVSVSHNFETAWKYRLLPVELLLASSATVVLGAVGAASVRGIIALAVTLFVLGGGMLWAFGLSQGPTLFSVGPGYLGGLSIATAVLVVLSNRLWTVKKLLPFLRLN